MNVRINYTRCMSTGVCVKIAPAVFQFDPKRKVQVVTPRVTDDGEQERVLKAASRCPRQAVVVETAGDSA